MQAAHYSDNVRSVGWNSQTNWQHTVYISFYVKAPGAYAYKKGMTVTDLVAAAGGFVRDERYKNMPELYIFPRNRLGAPTVRQRSRSSKFSVQVQVGLVESQWGHIRMQI